MASSTERALDAVERQIVAELQHDGRITVSALAKRVGVSEVTARRKLRRLQTEGIVQVVASVDPFLVGVESPAMVGLKVERSRMEDVARELCQHPAVRYVAATTGNFHLYVEVMATTNKDLATILLQDFINIEGVIDTETSLILKIYKQTVEWRLRGPGADGAPESRESTGPSE
jgi:Lrp/AsnC family transcriptional regulator, regulator for asnA, asnC and gidA